MSLLFLFASLALATEPTAVIDGTVVRGSAWLAVDAGHFLDALEDPVWESRVSGSGTRVAVLGRDGDCMDLSIVSPNVIHEARYELRRCRAADGVVSTLVSSNTFSAFTARWRAVPESGGARVTYEVDVTPSLWVPDALVRAETRRAVLKLLRGLTTWADAEHAGPEA